MSDTSPIHISLGDLAYQRLRDDIISCRLAPGERVTERRLSADTGLGVSPLRDALSRLDHDGLVRTLPRKGYQITPISPKSIDELFDIWELLGPEIMSRGVRNASDAQADAIVHAFRQVEASSSSSASGDTALTVIERLDNLFGLLAESAGNAYFEAFFLRLRSDMARVWSLILGSDPTALDLSEFWLESVLAERDGAAVARSTRKYIRKMRRRVLRIISTWPSVVDSEVVPLPVRD